MTDMATQGIDEEGGNTPENLRKHWIGHNDHHVLADTIGVMKANSTQKTGLKVHFVLGVIGAFLLGLICFVIAFVYRKHKFLFTRRARQGLLAGFMLKLLLLLAISKLLSLAQFFTLLLL